MVDSPNWNGGEGAVTLGNNSAGITGVVSAANSLVGSSAGDYVGSGGIVQLAGTGKYVVNSPYWNNNAGAVTMVDSVRGFDGVVSAADSLVGASSGDQIGSGGITQLYNGNILISSPLFGGGEGAVTWADVSGVLSGVVGAGNSLVGAGAGDEIGSGGILQLSNGSNYVIFSPNWGGGKGAITNGNSSEAVTGVVGAGNSLVGASTADAVGSEGSVLDPYTGYYIVTTANYGNGAGAVTYSNDFTPTNGVISASNSLVGSSSGDHVGSGGVKVLSDNNYVVVSPGWSNGTGAVTWGSSSAGVSGAVGAGNSFVGAAAGDGIGSAGVIQLSDNADYVVLSPGWGNGKGAVTDLNANTATAGTVSASNSLVGASAGDGVGSAGSIVDPYDNYYLVKTANFGGGAGAVTWNNDAGGTVGVVSAANSLVGSSSSDHVGSGGVVILDNGNYVVDSPQWNNATGAVTVASAEGGVSGTINSENSLTGATPGEVIGNGGITLLPGGDFVVVSHDFNNDAGAVTWIDATSGLTGTVSATNSLVGAQSGDDIGSGGIVRLNNGANYIILSPHFNGDAGAVTNGSDTVAITGVIGPGNSLIGANPGDGVGSAGSIQDTAYGYYLVKTLGFADGAGAVTYNSEALDAVGVISATNSLIGSTAADGVGSGGVTILGGNHGYVVSSPNWNGGEGASTFGSAAAGVAGLVGASNSLVGATGGDHVGSGGLLQLSNGNYLVISPHYGDDAGAVTFVGGAGLAGVVSAANSLVGATGGDMVGNSGIALLANGNYLVLSTDFGGGEGAVTFGNNVSGVAGVVSAANSLVGVSGGDHVGSGGIIFLSNGNYLVQSPDFAGSAGAVTWGSAATGVSGQVTKSNSIIGGMPESGEEYAGESANGDFYFVSFTTDTSAGGDGRVIVGSTGGPSSTPAPEDFFLLPEVDTVEASEFNFIAGNMAFYVADPDAPPHGASDVDSPTGGAVNSGQGNNLASGSSTEFTPGHLRLVTPGNGVWNIFGGLVHSAPPPQWIMHELQLNLSPEVYTHLNEILFGSP